MNKVTATVTACNRLDYLEKTLKTFLKYNTHPIEEYLVRDDSGKEDVWNRTKNLLESLNIPYKLLTCGNLGQIESVDRLMDKVKTEWVFHTEEDWEYYKPGFIEKALDIWQDDFIQVWIRPLSDGIQTVREKACNGYTITQPTKFSFNPHLRSMKNYTPYSKIPKIHWSAEYSISQYYSHLKTGWLKEGYCKHIGKRKARGIHA